MDSKYIICGLIGSILFLIGDILLGWVDYTPVGKKTFFYISSGHGKGYKRSKIAVTMILATLGIPFLYLGMVCCKEVITNNMWKDIISFFFALTSIAWFIIHIGVALNVHMYSWIAENISEEKAIEASRETNKIFSIMMIIAYIIVFASFALIIFVLANGWTTLPKHYVVFTPLVGTVLVGIVEKILPKSKVRKVAGTIQLNTGLIIWFGSLLFV